MKKYIIFPVILLLLAINGFFIYRLWQQNQTAPITVKPTAVKPAVKPTTPIPRQNLNLSGTVVMGKDLPQQKTSCPKELYLVADKNQTLVDDKTLLQLRSPDSAKVGGAVLYQPYIGKKVKIEAVYRPVTNPIDSERLDCFSDYYVLVDKITALN